MGDFDNDSDRCDHQQKLLDRLRCAHVRRRMLRQVADRRDVGTHESAAACKDGVHQVEGEGLDRPALSIAYQRRAELDPVLIVRDEILVATTEIEDASQLLNGKFEPEPDDSRRHIVDDLVTRFVPTERNRTHGRVTAAEAILRLQDAGVHAGANHVAMLGGTDKGGNTPEPTDMELGSRTNESEDGPLVVVIDTGIAVQAPARTDKWLDGVVPQNANFDVDLLDRVDDTGALGSDGLLDLGAGHGTFVAGIVRQVAQNCRVRVLRALDTEGVGTEESIAKAIRRAGHMFEGEDEYNRRGVLNLSLGMETLDGQEPVALRLALNALPSEVLVVAAAGNARSGIPLWPAASKRVIGVASHRGDDVQTPSSWSNYGSWVDFSARGECVVSTFVEGEEAGPIDEWDELHDPHPDTFDGPDAVATWTGTSFSAPQVAGRLANLLAADTTRTLTRTHAQQQLQDATDARFSARYGYRLDILA